MLIFVFVVEHEFVPHVHVQVFPVSVTEGVLPSLQRFVVGCVSFGVFTAVPQLIEI